MGKYVHHYVSSICIILGYIVVFMYLRHHYNRQVAKYKHLYTYGEVQLIRKTVTTLGIFFVVICQYELITIVDITY